MEQELIEGVVYSDEVGGETLDVISEADKFNEWMFEIVDNNTHDEILEFGSGIGNISSFFVNNNRQISVSDMRLEYCEVLKKKFTGKNSFRNVYQIDIVDPDIPYDASSFTNDALKAIREIHSRNKIPLLAGGTGLYLRSLTEGLFDEVGKFPQLRKELNERLRVEGRSKLHEELSSIDCNSAIRIHVNDTQRLLRALEIYYATGTSWTEHLKKQPHKNSEKRFAKILQLGLTCDRGLLYDRINQRTLDMINNGLKEEVEGLIFKGYDRNLKSMQSIGYRHMISYLFDGWTDEKLNFLLSRDTRRYAKRQLTWFKKMNTEWHDVSQRDDILNRINKFLD